MKKPLGTLASLALGAALWGHFEAGWVRLRSIPVSIPGLPEELDGLRVVHLSDFHLGFPSRGELAVERAIEWTAAREPDLVLITGDLLSRPGAEGKLRELLERVPGSLAVLGNHDFAQSRDPFSKPSAVSDLPGTTVLFDEARTVELRNHSVQVVGIDPRTYRLGVSRPSELADPDADLRILLCHFPAVWRGLPEGAFHIVLAGHLHAGQLVLPYPGGRLTLAHPKAREVAGLYRRDGTVLHVSPGLGTTLVPFRFFARPEVTELVLRSA